jgi:hypothetical protein
MNVERGEKPFNVFSPLVYLLQGFLSLAPFPAPTGTEKRDHEHKTAPYQKAARRASAQARVPHREFHTDKICVPPRSDRVRRWQCGGGIGHSTIRMTARPGPNPACAKSDTPTPPPKTKTRSGCDPGGFLYFTGGVLAALRQAFQANAASSSILGPSIPPGHHSRQHQQQRQCR